MKTYDDSNVGDQINEFVEIQIKFTFKFFYQIKINQKHDGYYFR